LTREYNNLSIDRWSSRSVTRRYNDLDRWLEMMELDHLCSLTVLLRRIGEGFWKDYICTPNMTCFVEDFV
jgi:hypothetical protein